MKKSGSRACATSLTAADGSSDAVITPESNDVAFQEIAERHRLRLETTAQFCHQELVCRRWLGVQQPAADRAQGFAPQTLRDDRLDRRLDRQRERPPPDGDGVQ